jgi:hypothetical protein
MTVAFLEASLLLILVSQHGEALGDEAVHAALIEYGVGYLLTVKTQLSPDCGSWSPRDVLPFLLFFLPLLHSCIICRIPEYSNFVLIISNFHTPDSEALQGTTVGVFRNLFVKLVVLFGEVMLHILHRVSQASRTQVFVVEVLCHDGADFSVLDKRQAAVTNQAIHRRPEINWLANIGCESQQEFVRHGSTFRLGEGEERHDEIGAADEWCLLGFSKRVAL